MALKISNFIKPSYIKTSKYIKSAKNELCYKKNGWGMRNGMTDSLPPLQTKQGT